MKTELLTFSFFVLVSMFSQTILASDRHVHLNGEHLAAEDIQLMDQLWGTRVADGFYWLDEQTGAWGFEGSQLTIGVLQAVVEYNQQVQNVQAQYGQAYYSADTAAYEDEYHKTTDINMSQNGSVVSGNVNGQNCTYASAGGTTFRMCD
ncbi:hypothetical protein OLMES_4630 [Oleiphilus messinensis]|uniref:Uncharacterized protein n=1 Tax=Oleiphilus messinensis TaxID=141451 RepID=A0A1Y0IGI2_9GAMM|nr:hypothetical protein [Oleiphilus messinensis]ARU58625.1 hypothetical protein OLMES_4630 [Oleiphilus messinensis]